DVPSVVVTLGDRGCCARADGEMIMQSAFAVMPVDTTAAGDAFCGVLVASLSQGLQLSEALRHANAAGALTCTKAGAQSSIPTRVQLQDFLLSHRGGVGAPNVRSASGK
ncbi:MAG: PfkB family carbohydrate kinase, partial [Steroidobacteraceae bacterium]